MKKFKVKLGLGRMANNHVKEYEIDADSEQNACSLAKSKYYKEVGEEIGEKNPIWGKILNIDTVEEIHRKVESVEELRHTWTEDDLFCSVCGVNKLYWNTRYKTTWCKQT